MKPCLPTHSFLSTSIVGFHAELKCRPIFWLRVFPSNCISTASLIKPSQKLSVFDNTKVAENMQGGSKESCCSRIIRCEGKIKCKYQQEINLCCIDNTGAIGLITSLPCHTIPSPSPSDDRTKCSPFPIRPFWCPPEEPFSGPKPLRDLGSQRQTLSSSANSL